MTDDKKGNWVQTGFIMTDDLIRAYIVNMGGIFENELMFIS
jgi:hypothetical protein